MIAGALIVAGYLALVIEFGWIGLALGLVHAAILVLATWRRRRDSGTDPG